MGSHLSSIFAKLDVDGRSQAINMARDVGLGRGHGAAGHSSHSLKPNSENSENSENYQCGPEPISC